MDFTTSCGTKIWIVVFIFVLIILVVVVLYRSRIVEYVSKTSRLEQERDLTKQRRENVRSSLLEYEKRLENRSSAAALTSPPRSVPVPPPLPQPPFSPPVSSSLVTTDVAGTANVIRRIVDELNKHSVGDVDSTENDTGAVQINLLDDKPDYDRFKFRRPVSPRYISSSSDDDSDSSSSSSSSSSSTSSTSLDPTSQLSASPCSASRENSKRRKNRRKHVKDDKRTQPSDVSIPNESTKGGTLVSKELDVPMNMKPTFVDSNVTSESSLGVVDIVNDDHLISNKESKLLTPNSSAHSDELSSAPTQSDESSRKILSDTDSKMPVSPSSSDKNSASKDVPVKDDTMIVNDDNRDNVNEDSNKELVQPGAPKSSSDVLPVSLTESSSAKSSISDGKHDSNTDDDLVLNKTLEPSLLVKSDDTNLASFDKSLESNTESLVLKNTDTKIERNENLVENVRGSDDVLVNVDNKLPAITNDENHVVKMHEEVTESKMDVESDVSEKEVNVENKVDDVVSTNEDKDETVKDASNVNVAAIASKDVTSIKLNEESSSSASDDLSSRKSESTNVTSSENIDTSKLRDSLSQEKTSNENIDTTKLQLSQEKTSSENVSKTVDESEKNEAKSTQSEKSTAPLIPDIDMKSDSSSFDSTNPLESQPSKVDSSVFDTSNDSNEPSDEVKLDTINSTVASTDTKVETIDETSVSRDDQFSDDVSPIESIDKNIDEDSKVASDVTNITNDDSNKSAVESPKRIDSSDLGSRAKRDVGGGAVSKPQMRNVRRPHASKRSTVTSSRNS